MKLTQTKTMLAAIFCSTVLTTAGTDAAIISIADKLDATGGVSTASKTNFSVSGEESVYFAGTMTFDTVDDSASFYSFETYAGIDATGTMLQQWTKQYNGTGFSLNQPNAGTLTTVSNGDSITMVLKIDQTTGDYTYFLNPNLGDTEANNTGVSGTGANTSEIRSAQFRWGSGTTGVTDYTDFAIYTGVDTPFAVPEPGSLALLGLGGLCLLRRRCN